MTDERRAAEPPKAGDIAPLVAALQRVVDPDARTIAEELVRSVLELHRAGIERAIELILDAPAPGLPLVERLGRDDLVGSLLLLHGLHPVDFDTRVRQAIDRLRTSIARQGGEVELLGMVDGAVRVRVHDGGRGCGVPQSVAETVENALYDAAPDLTSLEIERPPDISQTNGFISLASLRTSLRPVDAPSEIATT